LLKRRMLSALWLSDFHPVAVNLALTYPRERVLQQTLPIGASRPLAASPPSRCISALSLHPDTRIQPRKIKACGNPRPAALIQIKSQVHRRLPQKRGYASGASFSILMRREKSGARQRFCSSCNRSEQFLLLSPN
jgi:hypothetical protein